MSADIADEAVRPVTVGDLKKILALPEINDDMIVLLTDPSGNGTKPMEDCYTIGSYDLKERIFGQHPSQIDKIVEEKGLSVEEVGGEYEVVKNGEWAVCFYQLPNRVHLTLAKKE